MIKSQISNIISKRLENSFHIHKNFHKSSKYLKISLNFLKYSNTGIKKKIIVNKLMHVVIVHVQGQPGMVLPPLAPRRHYGLGSSCASMGCESRGRRV